MRISIVTISFNQKKFLRQCIDSVLSQRAELLQNGIELEYIVVDPGSSDGSRELICGYGGDIVRVFEDDNGPANGLNKGFSRATGEIGGFLNSDDVLFPGSLNLVGAKFSSNPEVDVLMGNGLIIDEFGSKIKKIYTTEFDVASYSYGAVSFIQQSVFFRLQAFNSVGGFNEDNTTCWDGELFLDMALNDKKFSRTNEVLGGFRIHPEAITGSGRLTKKYLQDRQRLFLKAKGREWSQLDNISQLYWKFIRLLKNPNLFLNIHKVF